MRRHSRRSPRARAGTLGLGLCLLLAPAAALAELAHHAIYQGRVTNAGGVPQSGAILLGLSIFQSPGPGGKPLYAEEHPGVPLGPGGHFSVELGHGVPLSGTFSAALFSGGPRFLEVSLGGEPMSPRQAIGSVPTALVAERLAAPTRRFEPCADGRTLADHQTGLLWEKKSHPTSGATVEFHHGRNCSAMPQPAECAADVHDVRNRYSWGLGDPAVPAEAFNDFLARLNGTYDPVADSGCFEGYCDWRLPKISELATIMIGPGAAPGQPQTCPERPCIDPRFRHAEGGGGGAVAMSYYWSGTQDPYFPAEAWFAGFDLGDVDLDPTAFDSFVRAVRRGSCR